MNFFKHIYSFLLSITMFLLIIVLLANNLILNEKGLKKQLSNVNYYDNVYLSILESFENNTLESGLNIEKIKESVTKSAVKEDIDNMIDFLFYGETLKTNKVQIKNNIDEIINQSLKEANREPDVEEKKDISRLEENLAQIYEDEILIMPNILSKVNIVILKVKEILNTLLIILVMLTIMFTCIIVRRSKLLLNSIGISFTSLGLLLLSMKLIILPSYQNILIISEIFSKTCISIIDSYFLAISIVGIVSLISGISLIILSQIKYSKASS